MADWPAVDFPTRIRNVPDSDPTGGLTGGTFLSMTADGTSKGDWNELISSAPFSIAELILRIVQWGNVNSACLMDVGIGPVGQEVVLVPNIAWYCSQHNSAPVDYRLPIAIPAGARISLRTAAANFNNQFTVQAVMVAASLQSPARNTRAASFGASVASATGQSPNVINNSQAFNGAWSLINTPTPFPIRELMLCTSWQQSQTPSEGIIIQIEIAAGPTNSLGGGYRSLIRGSRFSSSPQGWRMGVAGPYPVNVPEGYYFYIAGTTPNNSFGNPKVSLVGFG